jgi:hypothetical protein
VSTVSKYSTIEVAVYRGEELLHSGKINDVAKAMGGPSPHGILLPDADIPASDSTAEEV